MQNHFVSNTTKMFTVLETHIEHSPKYIRHSIISKKYKYEHSRIFRCHHQFRKIEILFLK